MVNASKSGHFFCCICNSPALPLSQHGLSSFQSLIKLLINYQISDEESRGQKTRQTNPCNSQTSKDRGKSDYKHGCLIQTQTQENVQNSVLNSTIKRTKSVPGKQIFYFNIVIPAPQHITHSPSPWHSSTGQLCGKHLHLFEPYHSSLLFSVRLPSNSKTPSNPKLQEELRPGDEQIKLTGK